MSGFVYHGALSPLHDACKNSVPEIVLESSLLNTGSIRNPLIRKLLILRNHLRLLLQLRSRTQKILIRDFSNVPLRLVFLFLRNRRKQLRFLVNHNLQWTSDRRAEMAAFCGLIQQGAEMVFFEEIPKERLLQLGFTSGKGWYSLPHPVPETPFKRNATRCVSTIGIIGQYRPEKGVDDLLVQLEPLAQQYRLLLALPNIGTFRNRSPFSDAAWLELVDTCEYEDYLKTIAECDVIVLNHPAESYTYRASGLIADAAAAGVPLVVRNLPVMRQQISTPVSIGECYDTFEEIPECITRVTTRLAQGAYDFPAYRSGRSVEVLAKHLMEIFE